MRQTERELAPAVPFYGTGLGEDEANGVKAALQLHFAGTDERVNASWPDYEAALKKHHVRYQAYPYPDTQHGLHHDTTPRYDDEAAKLAWSRTLAHFKKYLR